MSKLNDFLSKDKEEIIFLLKRDNDIEIESFISVDDFYLHDKVGSIKNDSFALNCLLNAIIYEFGDGSELSHKKIDEEVLLDNNGLYFSSRTPDEIAKVKDDSRVSYGLFSGYVINGLIAKSEKGNVEDDVNVKEILSFIAENTEYAVQEDYCGFEVSDKDGNYLCNDVLALNEFFNDLKDELNLPLTGKEKEVADSMSYLSREDVLKAGGYEVICESPFEIKNMSNENSYISQHFAVMVFVEKYDELKNSLLSQNKRKFRV